MGSYFLIDEKQFHTLAKKWMKQKQDWHLARILFIFITLTWLVIINSFHIGVLVSLILKGILSGLFFGLIFGSYQFFAYRCGRPLIYMQKIYLSCDNDTVILAYHDSRDSNNLSVIRQEILFSAIEKATYQPISRLMIIYGDVDVYRCENSYDPQYTSTVMRKRMSFFLCFENVDEFLGMLDEHGIPIQYISFEFY